MTMSSLPLAALAEPSGFVCDPRFGATAPAADRAETVTDAWEAGRLAGLEEAREDAARQAAAEACARDRIGLSLARLDEECAETLRQRLLVAVAALCEAAIAPLALDCDALRRRIDCAVGMLSRADDDKILRLHPDDFALIGSSLPAGIEISVDPMLERGSVRVETTTGGVEDGPAHWRRAIAEALAQC